MLWKEYVFGKQTVKQLAEKHHRSPQWIRDRLDEAEISVKEVSPRSIVSIIDATFWGRTYGVIVARDSHLKENLYFKEIYSETKQVYIQTRIFLEQKGFKLQAVVIDGKRGAKEIFSDIPVQMCHFHQIAIVTRYITKKPKLKASKELRSIILYLKYANKEEFILLLDSWYQRWEGFLKEKTFNPETNRSHFSHRRLRSAYNSLRNNLPYLFTFEDYPYLNIPNTTNSLDGSFTYLKNLLRVHSGLKRERRFKVIQEILGK